MLDLEWGSAPRLVDRQIDKDGSARRVYIRDPDGVAYEFFKPADLLEAPGLRASAESVEFSGRVAPAH